MFAQSEKNWSTETKNLKAKAVSCYTKPLLNGGAGDNLSSVMNRYGNVC